MYIKYRSSLLALAESLDSFVATPAVAATVRVR
jgi:hypothetical protein